MRDYLELGCTPADEECAQVGDPDYYPRARKECWAYVRQLRRQFGEEPAGARLSVRGFAHDFGTYHEVVCYFEGEAAQAYAFLIDHEAPANWDAEARAELGLGPVAG